ncbi:hypothetical protein J6B78_07625, partial [Methanocorpusculum sp.]|nr:hypothetical protein [Methanocorpusculum sp.]
MSNIVLRAVLEQYFTHPAYAASVLLSDSVKVPSRRCRRTRDSLRRIILWVDFLRITLFGKTRYPTKSTPRALTG